MLEKSIRSAGGEMRVGGVKSLSSFTNEKLHHIEMRSKKAYMPQPFYVTRPAATPAK